MDHLKASKKMTLIRQFPVEMKIQDMQLGTAVKYSQGDAAATIQFELHCTNFPVGTMVSVASNAAGPVPPIHIPPTYVSASPVYAIGMAAQVPADYKCDIYINVYFRQTPPANASLSLDCYLVE